jgi:hypothetical protein
MTVENLVGSDTVRRATAALLALWLLTVLVYVRDVLPGRSTLVLWFVAAIGILTLMAFVHTTRGIYARWLVFAEKLHGVVLAALFGGIYLFIVPLFALMIWPFDVLKIRRRNRSATFWIAKPSISADLAFFRRLG